MPDKSISRLNRERLRRKHWKQNITTSSIAFFDLLLISLSILLGYFIRFHMEVGVESGIVESVPIAPLTPYLKAILFIDYFFLVLFTLFHLYRRDRARWFLDEVYKLLKSFTFGYIIITSLTFFTRTKEFQYSR
ncbi:hypothetical protein JW979_12490, partial [bacterium]|nr:hypothetical protein [candidate division CSSED10-310 bacterium]